MYGKLSVTLADGKIASVVKKYLYAGSFQQNSNAYHVVQSLDRSLYSRKYNIGCKTCR